VSGYRVPVTREHGGGEEVSQKRNKKRLGRSAASVTLNGLGWADKQSKRRQGNGPAS
jgi:hypothetical protein